TTSFTLDPMDVYNMCFVLRQHKEILGPRSLRYILKPGEPIKVVFEPWEIEVACPRSIYQGNTASTVRVWGRRRILILERLIPVAKRFTVHLLGTGLPSFYVADLGNMSFTLGLSGWTANDWSTSGNFDLMAPRADVDNFTRQRVFAALKETWAEKPDSLAKRLGMDRSIVLGALGAYTQAGRAIYDLNKDVYRVRELSREALPMDKLRFANPREESATSFLTQNTVKVTNLEQDPTGTLNVLG
ncbi:MAG: SWIM zinc finger-containing protein, partial [bacterium]